MSSAPLQRLKEVFHSAQQMPPNERSAFLDQTCGNDSELRRDVDSLLESSQQADGFMVDPPAQLAAEVFGGAELPAASGRTIGRYKLLQRIGTGGMGEVYLAERADQQFKMQVAIKLIKRGMDTDSVLRRFQHERQILASLEHPNIARLLDGGETEDGLPYFVMEYVRGERIDRYAEAKNLSLNQRLELFRQVCGAVSYAHQHLVVHRDLKPSNILVTADGVPKLLDFGIAKIIQADDGAAALATITVMPAMTPEYASPEQLRGKPMTTASDVYSLGVILYQLLVGQLPYRFTGGSPNDLARVITEQEPTRPSTAVKGRDSTTGPRRTGFPDSSDAPLTIHPARSLRGDLDNIVLLALRKEPERRYQSVEQFSEDIQRHLEERPVFARKDTIGYRSSKFVRRNKLALAAAALLLLTLVGGILATTWEAHKARLNEQRARAEQARAERRFNDVRKLANTVLFDYHDAIKSLPGSTKVRERLVKDALTYLDSLSAEAHGDIALQRELAAAYERVGDVRGGLRTASLGDTAGAADSYTKALRIREALAALQPGDAPARRDLANAQRDLGTCLTATEPRTAVEHLNTARTLLLELTREQPTNEEVLKDLTDTSSALGQALAKAGDLNGALEQYRAAASIPQKLVERKPREPKYILLQVTAEQNLARALWEEQGDEAGAKAAVDKALELLQALTAEDPLNTTYQLGLAYFYSYGGHIREENDPPAALDYFRRAVELREKLMKADPANSAAETGVADSYFGMARMLSHQGDLSQALNYYSKSAEHYERQSHAATNPNWTTALKAVTTGAGAAAMRAQSGSTDLALRECGRLTAHLGEIPDDPTNIRNRTFRAEAYEYLGYAYRDIAAASKASVSQSKQYAAVARDMFHQSVNIFDDARSRGGLDIQDTKEAKSVAEEIAKCDTALAK